MGKILYIDTNIYLRFFDSNSTEFKQLLRALNEIQDAIFMTQQIVDEVRRNKLDVFIKSVETYVKQFGMTKIYLPEHLETETDEAIKNWNKKTKKLEEDAKNLDKDLKKIMTKLMQDISENKDELSIMLNRIFTNPKQPKDEQLKKARLRKDLGNPPGKKLDPIGDQISWEQLLDQAAKIDELWIISNDSDYMVEFNKTCYLNSFLRAELEAENSELKIHAYNTLSEGLRSYTKENKISTLPSSDILLKITREEKLSNQLIERKIHLDYDINLRTRSQPNLYCDFCGGTMTKGVTYLTKDGKINSYSCRNCNNSKIEEESY